MSEIRMVPGEAEYPRNQWYVAAFSREVERGKLFARTLLDEAVTMYRDRDDKIVALQDRCPHRGIPLSMGKIVAPDSVQCIYHGYRFDTTGRCTHIPAQEAVPSKMCVRRYPTVEKWKWIWIFMGHPEKADPALIPDHDHFGLTLPDWHTADGHYVHAYCNYLLAFENFADSTHVSFLHEGQLEDGTYAKTPATVEVRGSAVLARRVFKNFKGITGEVDRTLTAESHGPHCVHVAFANVPSSAPDSPPSHHRLTFAITPETPRSVHQFQALAGTAPPREGHHQALTKVFAEDKVATEAIQRSFDATGSDRWTEVHTKADAPHLKTRQIIKEMIANERAAGTARVAPVA